MTRGAGKRVCKRWSELDEDKFARMWPSASWKRLYAAFPGRTHGALEAKGKKMGLTRPRGPRVYTKRKSKLLEDITDARMERRITYVALAKKAGFSKQRVQAIETDGVNTTLFTLQCICDVLGLELRAVPKGREIAASTVAVRHNFKRLSQRQRRIRFVNEDNQSLELTVCGMQQFKDLVAKVKFGMPRFAYGKAA